MMFYDHKIHKTNSANLVYSIALCYCSVSWPGMPAPLVTGGAGNVTLIIATESVDSERSVEAKLQNLYHMSLQ